MKIGVCALAVAVLLFANSVQAREEVRLEPSSRWNVDYADDGCRLLWVFGTGDAQIVLQ